MLLAMSRLHSSGMPNLKPDAFTYTAVIDVSEKNRTDSIYIYIYI